MGKIYTFSALRGSTSAQCTQLVTGCRWKPIWFLCVTESFSWTTGPQGTKTERNEGDGGREWEREWEWKGGETELGERDRWGRAKTGRPGPPGQTIAVRWERGSRALSVPKVHSCRSGQAGGSKRTRRSSGAAPSEENGAFWNKSLGCYGDLRDGFNLALMWNDACLRPAFIKKQTEKKKNASASI